MARNAKSATDLEISSTLDDVAAPAPTQISWTPSMIFARRSARDVLVPVGDWRAEYITGTGLRGKVRLQLRRLSFPGMRVVEVDPLDGELFDSHLEAQASALNVGRIEWLGDRRAALPDRWKDDIVPVPRALPVEGAPSSRFKSARAAAKSRQTRGKAAK
jgi:hypothetical protein